jgi:hypothetical protein
MTKLATSLILQASACALLLATAKPALAQSTCPAANPNDYVEDDAALNACLAAGGIVTLVTGSPGYIVKTGLSMTVANTTLQGATGTRPVIIAHPALNRPMLMTPINASLTGFTIRDLVFDGNKGMRTHSCVVEREYGFNLRIFGSGWTVERVDSDNTLCGTAMEAICNNCNIRNNRVRYSGTPYNIASHPNFVSDGITVLSCTNGLVHNNEVGNATDVSLVVGPGSNCRVHTNWIWQTALGQVGLAVAFAGDHSGSRVDNNLVQALPNMLAIGLVVGDHPWNVNGHMANAGLVDYNNIQGAVILAAIDGILAGTFQNNVGSDRQGTFPLPNCIPYAYTAGHHGSASLQGGWAFQTYHNGACQQQ